MESIKEMTNEKLLQELERINQRMQYYSASNEGSYKNKLKDEILKRMKKERIV